MVHASRRKYEYQAVADAEAALSAVDVTTGAFEVFDTDGYEWLPVPDGDGVRLERLHLSPDHARYALNLEHFGGWRQFHPHSVRQVGAVLMLAGLFGGSYLGDLWGLFFAGIGLFIGFVLYLAADRRGWILNRKSPGRPLWDGLRARRRKEGRGGE